MSNNSSSSSSSTSTAAFKQLDQQSQRQKNKNKPQSNPSVATWKQIEQASTSTPTPPKPGYSSSGNYYVGRQGQSDESRTREAINYYKSKGMTSQLNNALNYAKNKGYSVGGGSSRTTPSTPSIPSTPSTAHYRQIENNSYSGGGSSGGSSSGGRTSGGSSGGSSSSQGFLGNIGSRISNAYKDFDAYHGGILPGGAPVNVQSAVQRIENSPAWKTLIGDPKQGWTAGFMAESALNAVPAAGGTLGGINAISRGLSKIPGVAKGAGSIDDAIRGAVAAGRPASSALGKVGSVAKAIPSRVSSMPTLAKVGLGSAAGLGGVGYLSSIFPGSGNQNGFVDQDQSLDQPSQNTLASPNQPQGVYGTGGGGGYTNTMTPSGGGGMPANTMTGGYPSLPAWGASGMTDASGLTGIGPWMPAPPQPIVQPELEMPQWMLEQQALFQQNWQQLDQMIGQNQEMATVLYSQLGAEFDRIQQQIMDMFRQQGTEIDPATQAALQEMRSQIDLRRKALEEEMNRRGIAQSGIWADLQGRIMSDQMTAEERLLTSRVADMQNRMSDALMGLAQSRLNMMGQQAQNQMTSNQWAIGQRMDAMNMQQAMMSDMNQWWSNYVQQERQNQAANQQAQQNYGLSYLNYLNDAQRVQNDTLKTQYDINKPYYNPYSGGSRSGSSTSIDYDSTVSGIQNKLASGQSPEAIKNELRLKASSIGQPQLGEQYAAIVDQMAAGTSQTNYLDQRPWWQQAVDTILPFSQFR